MAQYDHSVKSQYNSDPSGGQIHSLHEIPHPRRSPAVIMEIATPQPPLTPFPRPNLSELFVAQGSRD
ncbi:hypothetical protein CEXT_185731 [Caerostris extrusa]|uniref:Uncharacterized protein n=1 Tax=Caerostris extrusa TaxID=172846 RepID=A0AAV4VJE5_CAEEX|nr:hypothetical protein CEXT_185731 [Caerostris extrusa]